MSPENASLTEAVAIDAELRELRSFVSVETRHAPTVRCINDLRRRVAKAFGHTDLWCVEHCAPGARHFDCKCRCGQHRNLSSRPEESVTDIPDDQMAHFVKVCGLLSMDKEQISNALAFLLGSCMARLNDDLGPYSEQEWMDVVSEATASATTLPEEQP